MPTRCPHCNLTIDADVAACPHCGEALPTPAPSTILPTPIPVVDPGRILPFGEFQQAVLYRGIFRSVRYLVVYLIIGILLLLGAGLMIHSNYLDIKSSHHIGGFHIRIYCYAAIITICGIIFLVEGISAFFPRVLRKLLFNPVSRKLLPNGQIKFFAMLQQYSSLLAKPPAPDMQAKADTLLDRLQKAKLGKSSDIIEFTTFAEKFPGSSTWRGLLQPDLAIFSVYAKWCGFRHLVDIYLASPAGIDMQSITECGRDNYLEENILSINGEDFCVRISPDNYQRFLTWKTQTQSSSAE